MTHHATRLAGSTAVSPACPDAELITTCAAFCELERASDVVTQGFAGDFAKEAAGEAPLAKIVAEQDVLVERMVGLPCTTLAGVQAMAKALAAWDRELLKDGPARDVGEAITSNMVERLLALQRPDASRMIGGPLSSQPPARLYGKPDGSGAGAGIEAFGLSVQIEVGKWDTVISASPVADDGWCGVPLDDRLPELVRALTLMMELRGIPTPN